MKGQQVIAVQMIFVIHRRAVEGRREDGRKEDNQVRRKGEFGSKKEISQFASDVPTGEAETAHLHIIPVNNTNIHVTRNGSKK